VRALPCAEEERGAVAKGHDGRVHRHRRDVPVCILQYNGASNILQKSQGFGPRGTPTKASHRHCDNAARR
jgi:hypothetical protein